MSTTENNQRSERVTKSARQVCYAARDAFFSCVRESGVDFTPGTPAPPKCKAARARFEADCLASWVSRPFALPRPHNTVLDHDLLRESSRTSPRVLCSYSVHKLMPVVVNTWSCGLHRRWATSISSRRPTPGVAKSWPLRLTSGQTQQRAA